MEDLILVETFNDLLDMLEIDYEDIVDEEDEKKSFKPLKQAIKKKKVFINDDGKVVIKLNEPVKMFDAENPETDEIVFKKRAGGYERRICANAPENKRGDAIQKCISSMTNIRQGYMDKMDSKELAILEDIFSLFL